MRRAATTLAILSAAAWPAAAVAQEHGAGHGESGEHGAGAGPPAMTGSHLVAIVNRAFSPARVTALAGDSVTWRNDDFVAHDVTSPDGSGPSSSTLTRGQRFTHSFAGVGSHPFVCSIHPFMRGSVEVHGALLTAGSESVLAGEEVALHGRAPGGNPVALEAQPAGAPGFTPLTTVAPGPGGEFHAAIRPSATTTYRAVSGLGASPPVTVSVASRLSVRLSVHASPRFTRVRVTAPGAGAATATIQLYSRERFTWIDARRRRLDPAGRAVFRLRAGLRYHARAVVTRAGEGGTVLGTSAKVKLPRRVAAGGR